MGTRGSAFSIVVHALASAPFAVTLFAVAMMFGADLTPTQTNDADRTLAPTAPEPAKAKPSKEEVTYEPWELVST